MQHIIIIIIVAGSQILLASSSRADSTLAKRYIMHHFVHELPAGADTLPYSEFEKLLDRYTWIMSVDEAKEFKTTYRGESFGRIGISSRNHILGIVIDGVAPGSPAYYAGLSAGDIITAINDSSLMVDVARKVSRVTRFRGKSGTPIGIEYMRNGRCHRAVVNRADLDEPALTWVGRPYARHPYHHVHPRAWRRVPRYVRTGSSGRNRHYPIRCKG
jgi:membrane-associated protease RseP (regulator of RpoE activity)